MRFPKISNIVIINGTDKLLPVSSACLADFKGCKDVCNNLYEAVRLLAGLSDDMGVLLIAPLKELSKENGSFLSFLERHPNIRCLALHPGREEYPLVLQQAVWEGKLWPCLGEETLPQAIRWITKHNRQAAVNRQNPSSEPDPISVSPEEIEALFNSE